MADEIRSAAGAMSAEEILAAMGKIADRMRETAAELRAGKIHPAHAANRLDKLARELDGKGPENTDRV